MAIDDVQLRFSPAVAANASISGKVIDANGRGIPNAIVKLTDFDGNVFSGRSNAFGYYSVTDIPVGENYAATVSRKGYSFPTQVISINNDLTDVNFVAEE
jgi:hypothetical protein